MPDQSPAPSFEHQALEADIKHLAEEIRGFREHPEAKSETANEKELIKQAILSFPNTQQHNPSTAGSQSKSPLPNYAQSAPAEIKLEIEYLLDMAFHQGLGKALIESKKSPYFVQDAFHDALAGKLYPELKRRGIVK